MINKIFSSGDDFFVFLQRDINNAKTQIQIEMYKFNAEGIGRQIIEALIKKAKSGVKVSILVDGIGSKNWGGSILKDMSDAGIKSKIYHPIPWQFHKFKHAVSNLPALKKFFYLFARINTRNHRKIVCIDDKIVYLGSINISDDHVSLKGKPAWADCAIRIESPEAANDVTTAFNRAYAPDLRNIYQGLQQTISMESSIVLNNNLVKRRQNFKRLLKKIRKAQTRVWLVSAYFTPNSSLLRALTGAANRGVDVRLIIPKQSDVPFVNLAAKHFYASMIRVGIKILEYGPTMMHSKYMIVDNWAMIGTSNLNHRSIMHDLEVDYITMQEGIIRSLESLFQDSENKSTLIDNNHTSISFLKKLLSRIIIFFKIVL